jgi:hypothetical protein
VRTKGRWRGGKRASRLATAGPRNAAGHRPVDPARANSGR